MIAVSLTRAQDFKKALNSGADYLEVRTDYFTDQQLQQFVTKSTLPVIYTVKRPTRYLPNVAYTDIDYTSKIKVAGKVIRSFHDYKRTPSLEYLDQLIKTILKQKALPKVATMINSVEDLYTIAKLQKKYGRKIIAIGMGELGMMTRVYNQSLLTFAGLSRTTTSAPGQLTIKALKTTRIFGLVGDNIAHSLSPKLHGKQNYRYQLWQTNNFKQFIFVFNHFQLPGASVTKPFKQVVIPYCDRLDVHAKKIGAVNTVVRKGRQLVGYNTDWIGIEEVIGKYLPNKRVLILGRGGAAQAVAYTAKRCKAKSVTLLNSKELPTTITEYDVLVNATPVYDQLLVPAASLRGKVVMDCNYGRVTKLCTTARQQQARVVLDGLPMLKGQAVGQIAYFEAR